jgi:hypothetical protein
VFSLDPKNSLVAGVGRELGLEGLGCDGKPHVSGCSHAPNLSHKGGIDGGERDGDIGVLCFGRWTWDKKPGGVGGGLFFCVLIRNIPLFMRVQRKN